MTVAPDSTPNSPDPPSPPLPRRRFQFSLATLLWMTTVVACLAALWVTYQNLRDTRRELLAARSVIALQRAELGYLNIADDPSKFYARGIGTAEANRWLWRIHVPENQKFDLCMATKRVLLEGLPKSCERLSLYEFCPPWGELFVEASAGPAQDGKWHLAVQVTKRSSGASANVIASVSQECEMIPLAGRPIEGKGGVGVDSQQCLEPGSPLILARYREISMRDDPQPSDGVMIWIEEAK
jgi:hypothetical protein